MTEDPPTYEHEGQSLIVGPIPDTELELISKFTVLSIKVGRYKYALQAIAGLATWSPGGEEAIQTYALQVLKAYNDHQLK
jgi:hypothetical protein